jgi:hypothetical protein
MISFPGFTRPYAIDTYKNKIFACLYGSTKKNIILFDYNDKVLAQTSAAELGIKNAISIIVISRGEIVVLDSESCALIWLDWNLQFLSKLDVNSASLCDLKISADRNTLFSLCGDAKKIFSCNANSGSDDCTELDFSHISEIHNVNKFTQFTKNNFLLLDSENSQGFVIANINDRLTLQDSFLEYGRNGSGFVRNPTDINYLDGYICINDHDNYLVQFFNAELEFKFQVGGKGDDIDSFDLPITACFSHESVLICDLNNDRVVQLTFPNQNSKPCILINNDFKEGDITRPSGLCSFEKYVIAADRTNGVINIYDESLLHIQSLAMDRNLHRPSSIALIREENKDLLVIMERGNGTDSKLGIFNMNLNGLSLERDFKLDKRIKLRDPQDMDSDNLSNIYIANTMEREILKISSQGELLKKANLIEISGHTRILVKCVQVSRSDQTIFTADFEKKIIFHFDKNLVLIGCIDLSSNSEIEAIRSVYPLKDSLLLCVRGKDQVIQISHDGTLIQAIDVTTSTSIDWHNPTKISILDSGNICIADKENDRIIVLNPKGKFLSST